MIVLSVTESYLKWLEIFLKSFKHFNGDSEKIVLNTLNCELKQTNKFKKQYKNLIVNNTNLSIEEISKITKYPKNKIIESKNGCESTKKEGHRLWMNFFADGFRIEKFYEIILNYPKEEYYIHMDADVIFRGKINKIINSIKNSDVNLVYRAYQKETHNLNNIKGNVFNINAKLVDSKLYIAILGINNTKNGINFVKKWVENINSEPFNIRNKWKWGQLTALKTFNELKDIDTKILRIPDDTIYSGKKINEKPNAVIWFFKQKTKSDGFEKAFKELERITK